ncbi:hypothetical protein BPTFM16_01839 [Altererythrobacter insulae]|nr:hypothetical protein BPTFM16_01839 [Altererythrobacter insulae]
MFLATSIHLLSSEPVKAQDRTNTVSIYTYRTVTARLTNENERLSGVAVVAQREAAKADQNWRAAQAALAKQRRDSRASLQRIAELESEARDRAREFGKTIDTLNGQLAKLDEEFRRTLQAAVEAGSDLLESGEGQRALELIALGGEENAEAGINILLAEQEIQDRADKLRIADRARSIALTLLGLRGTAPSADTAAVVRQFETVVRNDPSRHSDWFRLGKLYYDSAKLSDALSSSQRAIELADGNSQLAPALTLTADIQEAMGDLPKAALSHSLAVELTREQVKLYPSLRILKRDLVIVLNKLGSVQVAQNDFDAARQSHEAALAIAEKQAERRPSWVEIQRHLSITLGLIGDLNAKMGNVDLALEHYFRGYEISKALATKFDQSTTYKADVAISLGKIGGMHLVRGELSIARQYYREALQISEDLVSKDPTSANLRRLVINSHWILAGLSGGPGEAWLEVVKVLEATEADGLLLPQDAKLLPAARQLAQGIDIFDPSNSDTSNKNAQEAQSEEEALTE